VPLCICTQRRIQLLRVCVRHQQGCMKLCLKVRCNKTQHAPHCQQLLNPLFRQSDMYLHNSTVAVLWHKTTLIRRAYHNMPSDAHVMPYMTMVPQWYLHNPYCTVAVQCLQTSLSYKLAPALICRADRRVSKHQQHATAGYGTLWGYSCL
jgi:hypothetical protein